MLPVLILLSQRCFLPEGRALTDKPQKEVHCFIPRCHLTVEVGTTVRAKVSRPPSGFCVHGEPIIDVSGQAVTQPEEFGIFSEDGQC